MIFKISRLKMGQVSIPNCDMATFTLADQRVTSASKHQNGQKGPKAMAMAQGNQGSANARIARLNKIQ